MNRMRHLLWLLALLCGCADYSFSGDPMDRPGTWTATGANDANLRAMIADPQDLVSGADAPNSLGAEAAPPIGLLLSGKRPALIDEPTSQLGTSSGGNGGGGGGGGAAAPGGGGGAGAQ